MLGHSTKFCGVVTHYLTQVIYLSTQLEFHNSVLLIGDRKAEFHIIHEC